MAISENTSIKLPIVIALIAGVIGFTGWLTTLAFQISSARADIVEVMEKTMKLENNVNGIGDSLTEIKIKLAIIHEQLLKSNKSNKGD